jgi:putative Mg2+ transporter-C (MgtC) family protein
VDILLDELRDEFSGDMGDARLWVRIALRLLLALILTFIIGWEREREGKSAGLRTHILVALGAAIFALAASENGATPGDLTRVSQGVATGIGFIGGGVILKLQSERRVKGLTTAAGIWLTAAIGLACGMGRAPVAILGTLLCWVVLAVFHRLEKDDSREPQPKKHQPKSGHDESDSTT